MTDNVKVETPAIIATGNYTGTIVRADDRVTTKGFKYKDYYITVDVPNSTVKPERKISLSKFVSSGSHLGRFLAKFGVILVPDTVIDIDCIVGRRVSFDIVNEPDNDDPKIKYSNIAVNTVEPIANIKKYEAAENSQPAV